MYVLSYVTSVGLSSWINKGDYYCYCCCYLLFYILTYLLTIPRPSTTRQRSAAIPSPNLDRRCGLVIDEWRLPDVRGDGGGGTASDAVDRAAD